MCPPGKGKFRRALFPLVSYGRVRAPEKSFGEAEQLAGIFGFSQCFPRQIELSGRDLRTMERDTRSDREWHSMLTILNSR
jgi:hypothetical protein